MSLALAAGIGIGSGGGSVVSVGAADPSVTIGGTAINPTVGVPDGLTGAVDVSKHGAVGDAVLSTTMTATAASTTVTDPNLQTFVGTRTVVVAGAGTDPGSGQAPYGLKTTLTCTVAGTGTLGTQAITSIAPVNAVQTITETGAPTGGTFKLIFFDQVTADIAWNSTAAQAQAILRALPNVGPAGVVCAGGPLNTTPITVTFQGPLGNMPLFKLVFWVNNLTGGASPGITTATTTAGKSGMAVYGTDDTVAIQAAITAAAATAVATGQKVAVTGRPGASYLVPFTGPTLTYPGIGGTVLGLQIAANVILKGMSFLCGDFTLPGGNAQAVIGDAVAGTNGWGVVDCTFNGTAAPNTADHEFIHWGIVLSQSTDVRIINNSFTLFRQTAINMAGASQFVRILNNDISLCNGAAIKPVGQWIWIENNVIHDNYNCWAIGGVGTGAECIFFNSTGAGINQFVFVRGNYVGNWGACLVAYNMNLGQVSDNIFNTQAWTGAGCVEQYSSAGNVWQNTIFAHNIMILPAFSTSNGFWEMNNEQFNMYNNNLLVSANDFPVLYSNADPVGISFLDNLSSVAAPDTGQARLSVGTPSGVNFRHGGGTAAGVTFTGTPVTTPAVPASTVGLQNTFPTDVTVYLHGGTGTVVEVAYGGYTGNYVTTGLTLAAGTHVNVPLRAGDFIRLTYTVAPTWVWVPVL